MFKRPADELVEELNSGQKTIEVPIIDLSNILDSGRRKETVDEVRIASEEWGYFEDLELKKELYTRDPTKKVRFNSNFDLHASQTADWRDTLTFSFRDNVLILMKFQHCADK
ncbi:hypothetical protein PTKIN_Ptkin09bG0044700 [Pterospermum kingtungense]